MTIIDKLAIFFGALPLFLVVFLLGMVAGSSVVIDIYTPLEIENIVVQHNYRSCRRSLDSLNTYVEIFTTSPVERAR